MSCASLPSGPIAIAGRSIPNLAETAAATGKTDVRHLAVATSEPTPEAA